ncbi:hypothetical protein [Chondrinema litorale]|uniref:hypothetical protein n=1 Tax=Chondrinema litorale TaxID=2994555 RepID=UPI0025431037|nr:hypothetical protein [Chondrinema litorale]UZR99570.1 hypothetical protein OQ292_37545 [Chondrinema litorale]
MEKIKGAKLLYESSFLRIELCNQYHVLSVTWLSGISKINDSQIRQEVQCLIQNINHSTFSKILIDERNFSYLPIMNINLCFYQIYKDRLSHLNLEVGILKHTDSFHAFNSCQTLCKTKTQCNTFHSFDTKEEAMNWVVNTHSLVA